MPTPYTPDAFAYRVKFAVAHISRRGGHTRTFDTCFEMNDGDAVAVAVYRRARRNPRLRKNLWHYLGRSSVLPTVWKNRRRKTSDLPAWAAQMRLAARESFAAFMAAGDVRHAVAAITEGSPTT